MGVGGGLVGYAVSLQNARGSEKGNAIHYTRIALAAKGGLHGDVIHGCSGEAVTELPPPSRPRAPVTHMRGPCPLGLLPPRRQQAAGREEADNFLIPGA